MISVEGLKKSYDGEAALNDVSFTIPEGEIFGFIGSNGAGKTTTIRILSTLLKPDDGEASIGGVSCTKEPEQARRLIGYVPDFFGLYQRLTAIEYLEFYAGIHRTPIPSRRTLAEELLELVGLTSKAQQQVDGLSRGLQQRLCLARALVHDPPVLLLDEPASGLDPRAQVEMRELIKELRVLGKTVLISSHHLPDLEEVSTWIGLIEKGKIIAVGPIAQVQEAAGSSDLRETFLRLTELTDQRDAATQERGLLGAASHTEPAQAPVSVPRSNVPALTQQADEPEGADSSAEEPPEIPEVDAPVPLVIPSVIPQEEESRQA